MSTDADFDVFAQQSVRNGNTVLKFLGKEIARSSSLRSGVQRWSELVAYQTVTGGWICQRIGHSTVAHRPECAHVSRRMPSWLDAHEEAKIHRTPCVECQPVVGDGMDPHTRLEAQRYTIIQANSATELVATLTDGRDSIPEVVSKLLSGILAKA